MSGMAFVFGIVHALEPGHGKAVMLAYMIDGRKSVLHAVGFGILSGVLHVAAILGVLGLIHFFGKIMPFHVAHSHGDHTHIVSLISGGILIALGVYLLIKHNPDKADCCEHHHPEKKRLDLSLGGVFALLVGVLTCPSSLGILVSSLGAADLWKRVGYVLVYGAGVSISMVGLGLVFLLVGKQVQKVLESRVKRFNPVTIQAVLFIGLGVWLLST